MLRTLALTALLAGAAAAPASAATITPVDGRLVFTAAAGEANHVTMSMLDTGPVIVRDSTAPLTGCGPWSHPDWPELPDDLLCVGGAPKVVLGDGDDALYVTDAGTEMPIGTTEADGGPGDDALRTGISDDVLRGGPGDDELWAGEQGDDTLDGGPGADRISALWGDDTILARDGEADTVDCGEGIDTVVADRIDTVRGCETVDLPALPSGPSAAAAPPVPAAGPATAGPRTAGPERQISALPAARADRVAPKLRVSARGRTLTLRADEACSVTIAAGGRTLTRRLIAGRTLKVRVPGRARTIRLRARDAAGNVATTTRSLRRRTAPPIGWFAVDQRP